MTSEHTHSLRPPLFTPTEVRPLGVPLRENCAPSRNLRHHLEAFYHRIRQPWKVAEIDAMLRTFAGEEGVLVEMLQDKYHTPVILGRPRLPGSHSEHTTDDRSQQTESDCSGAWDRTVHARPSLWNPPTSFSTHQAARGTRPCPSFVPYAIHMEQRIQSEWELVQRAREEVAQQQASLRAQGVSLSYGCEGSLKTPRCASQSALSRTKCSPTRDGAGVSSVETSTFAKPELACVWRVGGTHQGLGASSPASKDVRIVAPVGAPTSKASCTAPRYTSIAEALAAAPTQQATEIYVYPGRYEEAILIFDRAPVSIIGMGVSNKDVVLRTNVSYGVRCSAAHVTLQNITLTNKGPEVSAVLATEGSRLELTNVLLQGGDVGLTVCGNSQGKVSRCLLTSFVHAGIVAVQGSTLTVTDTSVESCGRGVVVASAGIHLHGSVIRRCTEDGVFGADHSRIVLEHCALVQHGSNGLYASCESHLVLTCNTIADNKGYGVFCTEDSNALLVTNDIRNNTLGDATSNVPYNVTFETPDAT